MRLLKHCSQLSVILSVCFMVAALPARSDSFETYQKNPTLENAAEVFVEGMNNRDIPTLNKIVDVDGLLDRALNGLGDDQTMRDVKRGAKQGIEANMYNNWFRVLNETDGVVDFRRLINVDGQKRALVLMDMGESGMNFLELIVNPKTRKVEDIYVHTTGETLSQSMTKVFGMMMPNSSNFLKRILDRRDIDNTIVNSFRDINNYNRQGQYDKSYRKLKTLPQDVQDTRVISLMKVFMAQSLSDEVYRKELDQLDKLHGKDPEMFFILMDHYFFTEQYDRGISGLKMLNKRFGEDGAIENLISVYQFLKKDYTQALKHIDKAIAMEPEKLDHYWFKADVLNGKGDFKGTLAIFDKIESMADIYVDPVELRKLEGYEALVASDEFKRWAAKRE